MSLPSPSPQQARIFWLSVTGLALAVMLALVCLLVWVSGWVLSQLSSVLIPLAIAGVIAYLLDPVVDFLQARNIPRPRAIGLVFLMALALVLLLVGTVVPRLIVEVQDLATRIPTLGEQAWGNLQRWLQNSTIGAKAKQAWSAELGADLQALLQKVIPTISNWVIARLSQAASWFGLLIGLSLVPVYVFYFLSEKKGISENWTAYLPVKESRLKDEAVFVITAINEYLILFFRAQILVAICDGILLTIGFAAMGLNYSLLFGMVAGLLSIIPYLGITLSIIPTVLLAAVQFGDWLHPLLVACIFVVVQLLEGYVISPKIMGERVGLHPLTIIIAVMVGTTLLGGVLGGILAIPLTASLRVLMFRYVWRKPDSGLA